MRENKSYKGLSRIACLAVIFVFIVTAFSAALLTGNVGRSEKSNDNIALAEGNKPNSATELIIPETLFTVPFGAIGAFEYEVPTYSNFVFYTYGNPDYFSGEERTDTYAKLSAHGMNNGRKLMAYAYYKIPQYLIDNGAVVNLSFANYAITDTSNVAPVTAKVALADTISTAKLINVNDTDYVGFDGNSYYDGDYKVSENFKYIRVEFETSISNYVALIGSSRNKFTVSGIKIKIDIKSMDFPAPVFTQWNGSDAPINRYFPDQPLSDMTNFYTSGRNTVGNVSEHFKPGEDINVDGSIVSLSSLRTDGVFEKKFSFIVYDYFTGLQSVSFSNFELLTPYVGENPINTAGTATVFEDKSVLPSGIKSITVQPFGFGAADVTTGIFRGLQITVFYDGKTPANAPSEFDGSYRVNVKAFSGLSQNLIMEVGGLDYFAPEVANSLDYKLSNTVANGYSWFDVNDIEFKYVVADDARDVYDIINKVYTSRDVEYSYKLYVFDKTSGTWALFTKKGTTYEGIFTPNYNNKGDTLKLLNLDNGYYKFVVTASDSFGKKVPDAIDVNGNPHVQQREYKFAIDTGTVALDNDDLISRIYTTDDSLVENDYDGTSWTNNTITVLFNAIDTIGNVTYTYSLDKNGTAIACSPTDMKYIIADSAIPNEGFSRVYYFKATLESGKVIEKSVKIMFDNTAGVKPVSTILSNFSSDTTPYADLLPLSIDVQYLIGGLVKENYVTTGSPLKLWYQVGEREPAEADINNNSSIIDILGGVNPSAVTSVTIKLWFVDEAGNIGEVVTKDLYTDKAKLFFKFSANASVKKYYSNSTVAPTDDKFIKFTVYKDQACTIPVAINNFVLNYTKAYAKNTAGLQNVQFNNLEVLAAEGSPYTSIINNYEIYVFDFDDDIAVEGGAYVLLTDDLIFDAARHEILKARIVPGYVNKNEYYLNYVVTYNGTGKYLFENQDFNTFICLDNVVDDTWKNLKWNGTISYRGVCDTPLIAIILKDETLKLVGNEEIVNNYIITGIGGTVANEIKAKIKVNRKQITVSTTSNDISKSYDGTTKVNIGKFKLDGVCAGDDVRLDSNLLKEAEFSDISFGNDYTINVEARLLGTSSRNYDLVGEDETYGYVSNKIAVDKLELTFSNVAITIIDVTVNFGKIEKTIGNPDANIVLTKSITSGTVGVNKFFINGILNEDKNDISLVYSIVFPSQAIGVYDNVSVTVSLSGDLKDNYRIVDEGGNPITVITVSGEIVDRVVVFDDIAFDKRVFYLDSEGNEKFIDAVNFNVTFANIEFYLKIDESKLQSEVDEVIRVDMENIKNTGSYVFKLNVIRYDKSCLIEQNVVVNKVPTILELQDADVTYRANYGDIITTGVDGNIKIGGKTPDYSGLGLNLASLVRYEFCSDSSFAELLTSAPVNLGAGDYYVRAVFNGNVNFNSVISKPRKINIAPIIFNAPSELIFADTDTIEIFSIADVIDQIYIGYADKFVLMFIQQNDYGDGSYASSGTYSMTVPTLVGNYFYEIVHVNRVNPSTGTLIKDSISDNHYSLLAGGNKKGKLIIGLKELEASDKFGTPNDLGNIKATGDTVLPAEFVANGQLLFIVKDETNSGNRSNFINGLFESSDSLGGYYTVSKLYNTSLKFYYDEANPSEQYKTAEIMGDISVTLNGEGFTPDSKIVRFDINSDGTYNVTNLNYTKNEDGSITFTTDKLGWFTVAAPYVPEKQDNNKLGIGLGVGGGLLGVVLLVVIGVVISKKRMA